jgi:uncharacterized protein (DUF305 family)
MGTVRGRGAWWIVVALLAAGCAAPGPPRADTTAPAASDQADVWFMQHMVPHLRQKAAIVLLARGRVTHPALARLVDAMARRDQADGERLQRWLALRGLAPHGHSHQRADDRRRTDLERLARLRGTRFDLAFLEVMSARARTGIRICLAEERHGRLPEVRQLARRMLVDQRRELHQLRAWRQAWPPPLRNTNRPSSVEASAFSSSADKDDDGAMCHVREPTGSRTGREVRLLHQA